MKCEFCGYDFPDKCGRFGCPNCEDASNERKFKVVDVVSGATLEKDLTFDEAEAIVISNRFPHAMKDIEREDVSEG